MAIDDYRDYKKRQSSSQSRTSSSRTSSTSRSRTSSSSSRGRTSSAGRSSTTRKRPSGTVVKKRKRVKKYRLTKEGKEFFQKLGLFIGLGTFSVAAIMGLVEGGNLGNTQAETTTPPGIYGEDTRDKTPADVLEEMTGGVENDTLDTYVSTYAGKEYKFCSEEYALEIAQDAIDNVNEMFGNAGMNPLVPGSENYLPDYFDKYMLAGLAFQESTFRYQEADGDPIYSSVKARGMCQCKEDTLDYIKWYAKTVLGVELSYEFEDLDDPRISIEVAAMVLATNAENSFKPTRKNNAFSQAGITFSPEAQKTMMLSSYYHGANGVVNRLLKSGTTTSDYAKGILANEEMLRDKYGEMQR